MRLARHLDENWNLAELAREQFQKHGTTPAEFLAMSPFELVAMLGENTAGKDIPTTPLAELHRINHKKRSPAGISPSIPPYVMPDVPRRKRDTRTEKSNGALLPAG